MKIFGAFVLALAAPAFPQTPTATAPEADRFQLQVVQSAQPVSRATGEMREHCRNMMKHHAKLNRRAKSEAERITADVNGNGHQGHNH